LVHSVSSHNSTPPSLRTSYHCAFLRKREETVRCASPTRALRAPRASDTPPGRKSRASTRGSNRPAHPLPSRPRFRSRVGFVALKFCRSTSAGRAPPAHAQALLHITARAQPRSPKTPPPRTRNRTPIAAAAAAAAPQPAGSR
jgi:hypothetical protein